MRCSVSCRMLEFRRWKASVLASPRRIPQDIRLDSQEIRRLRIHVGRGARRVRRSAPTAVVFLTNRECPFRCVMCDLWMNTLDETVPRGAIAAPDSPGARPPCRRHDRSSCTTPAASSTRSDPTRRRRGDRAGRGTVRSRDRRVASGVPRRACTSDACAFEISISRPARSGDWPGDGAPRACSRASTRG